MKKWITCYESELMVLQKINLWEITIIKKQCTFFTLQKKL